MISFTKNENPTIKAEIMTIIPIIIKNSYIKNILTFISCLNYKCKDLYFLKKRVGDFKLIFKHCLEFVLGDDCYSERLCLCKLASCFLSGKNVGRLFGNGRACFPAVLFNNF